MLKFHSAKAYKFFIDAKDTHKSWQTLQTVLIGTTLGLIKQFKQGSLEQDPLKFLSWLSEDVNPSIRLVGELSLNITLAPYIFKNGFRANDVNAINAGRLKFDDLYYAFNHPIYGEVVYRDLRNRFSYPTDVRLLRDANMSFSSSQIPMKSQGGDFVLEGKVKCQKLIAPKGPVKSATWKEISRCPDEFDEIYSNVSRKLKLTDPDAAKVTNLGGEILA